jgi:hypothetical protein
MSSAVSGASTPPFLLVLFDVQEEHSVNHISAPHKPPISPNPDPEAEGAGAFAFAFAFAFAPPAPAAAERSPPSAAPLGSPLRLV